MLVSGDLERARKRMRNAWIAGFAWSAFIFVGAMGLLLPSVMFGIETLGPIDLGRFIYAIVEVGLMGVLAYGVFSRRCSAATLLFCYFAVSRVVLVAIGEVRFDEPPDMVRLLIQVGVGYLFFQGMRGAWTRNHLTHPQYPTMAVPSAEGNGGSDGPAADVETVEEG